MVLILRKFEILLELFKLTYDALLCYIVYPDRTLLLVL